MGSKKLIFVAMIGVLGFCAALGIVFAETTSNWNLPDLPNADNILNNLPAPVSDFVNSAKQIGDNLYVKTQNLNVNSFNPTNIFNGANNWFVGTTGVSLIGIIKGIGNLIVWVLTLVLNLINWGLSLIR